MHRGHEQEEEEERERERERDCLRERRARVLRLCGGRMLFGPRLPDVRTTAAAARRIYFYGSVVIVVTACSSSSSILAAAFSLSLFFSAGSMRVDPVAKQQQHTPKIKKNGIP